MNYKLVVDYGKPFELILNKKELFKELKIIKELDKDNYAYFDVFIYYKGKDVTDKIFKELEGGNKE